MIVREPSMADAMLAAFTALGFAVSTRVLLFLSLIGAFALAVMAMLAQSMLSIIVLSLYCLLTTIPLVFLEIRSKLAS